MPLTTTTVDLTKDRDALVAFVEAAPRYASFLMKGAVADKSFSGWWYAALDGKTPKAVTCIEGHTANVFGEDEDAIKAMAQGLLRSAGQSGMGKSGVNHQVVGVKSAIDPFFEVFSAIERTVIKDITRSLGVTRAPEGAAAPGVEVNKATQNDFKVVFEFDADATLQQWGRDPRRLDKAGHEKRTRELIDRGNVVIGRQGQAPFFLAEIIQRPDGAAMLERVFVPRPLRRRKLMVAALAQTSQMALAGGADEVMLFVNSDAEHWQKALPKAGYTVEAEYRLIVMR